ncbi:hypothetical protein [Chthonobacter rhizosphaerae]|uniref:hypothetical protein n=1 Tax=Chthonobacter rhizosphaerae TaxID=2735553 RepID=UPI0015EEE251|nr:hypothetical protein [Chthonobacter rhizosphaerae]
MTGFSADWLDLREAADAAARDRRLLDDAAALVDGKPDPLVVDLGAGTGATFRALRPKLRNPASWLLVDADLDLLQEAERRADGIPHVEVLRFDLAAPAPLPLTDATLVTASAFFDLVGGPFLERLIATAAANRAALYAALTYDGTTSYSVAHDLDAAVLAAFNRHQRGDKGFGPALGPTAPQALAEALSRAGYRVQAAASPWRLGPDDAALVRPLLTGMADAVRQTGDVDAAALDDWLAFRLDKAGDSRMTVGHVDVLARL